MKYKRSGTNFSQRIIQTWYYKSGWIRWAKKWHRIIRVEKDFGTNGIFTVLCSSVPNKEYTECEYSRNMPFGLCKWCLTRWTKNRKGYIEGYCSLHNVVHDKVGW